MAKKIEPVEDSDARLSPEEFLKTIPRMVLSPYRTPTEEDLRKRYAIAQRMDQFRESMGPIEGAVTDLIREDRSSH